PQESGGGIEVEVGNESEGLDASPSSGGRGGEGPKHWVLGAVAGGGGLGGQEFEGFGLGGVGTRALAPAPPPAGPRPRALSPHLSATSLAGQGLTDELELAADVSARYYLTPPHTFLGLYPLAGMRFGTLFWSYRTPVNVIADGAPKTIEDDYLNYFALYG